MMKLFNKNIDKIIQNQTNKWIKKISLILIIQNYYDTFLGFYL